MVYFELNSVLSLPLALSAEYNLKWLLVKTAKAILLAIIYKDRITPVKLFFRHRK